jgi:hypothetical protein
MVKQIHAALLSLEVNIWASISAGVIRLLGGGAEGEEGERN